MLTEFQYMYFTGSDGRRSNAQDAGEPTTCPKFGGTQILRIRYEMPGPEPDEAMQRGEVALGGCVIDERARKWQCAACNATFNDGGADLLEPIDYRPQWLREQQKRIR